MSREGGAAVGTQVSEQVRPPVREEHRFVVSVSYQLHGVTGCGETTKHIYIDGEERARTLKYFDPENAGATKAPILFKTKAKMNIILVVYFPGFPQ